MTEDVRLQIKVKNNLLLKKMEERGYYSVAQLTKAMSAAGYKIGQSQVGLLVNMKELPENKRDQWRSHVRHIADFLKCLPEDLFSQKQRSITVKQNVATAEMTFATFEQIAASPSPERLVMKDQALAMLQDRLSRLSPRQERILRLRFGLDGGTDLTLGEIAEQFGVHKERIRQIEQKAFRSLARGPDGRQLRAQLNEIVDD